MGLVELIEALPTIVSRVPDVLLCIAGRGLLREELERRAREAGVVQNVGFLGFVPDDDLPYLYRAADINVVPTQALEGFGLVAAESLAAGVPAMVTQVGGLPEVVTGLSSSLMFTSPRSADLADGLIDALLGRVLLPSSLACAAYARQHFNSPLMAGRIADVYREVL
jgi:glycosyltransferase involved in cell wall biosynthesis